MIIVGCRDFHWVVRRGVVRLVEILLTSAGPASTPLKSAAPKKLEHDDASALHA